MPLNKKTVIRQHARDISVVDTQKNTSLHDLDRISPFTGNPVTLNNIQCQNLLAHQIHIFLFSQI